MFEIKHLSLKNQITVLLLFLISALSIISTFTVSRVLILGLFICGISIYLVLKEIYPIKNKSVSSIILTLIVVYLLIRHPENPIFNIFYTLSIYLLINYNFEGVVKNIFLGTLLVLLTYSVLNLSPIIYLSIPLIFIFFSLSIFISHRYAQTQKELNYIKEKQLEELSIRDRLTGLYNRKFMEQKIVTIHSIWKRGIQAYSLIMVDVDYFKNYNDYYGHIQGDICLKTISSILQKQINRETDYAFRYGGEEFLLILGFTDSIGANVVASKINKALQEAKLPHCKSPINQYITVSMGVATISDKECSFLELLDKSDKALYVAKESGRNTIIHSRPQKVMS